MCSRRILFQEILPTRVKAHLARFLQALPGHPSCAEPLSLVKARVKKGVMSLIPNDPVSAEAQAWGAFPSRRRWQIETRCRSATCELALECPRLWSLEARLQLLGMVMLVYAFLLSLLDPVHHELVQALLRFNCHRTGKRCQNTPAPLVGALRHQVAPRWVASNRGPASGEEVEEGQHQGKQQHTDKNQPALGIAEVYGPPQAEALGHKYRGIVGIVVKEASTPVPVIIAENDPSALTISGRARSCPGTLGMPEQDEDANGEHRRWWGRAPRQLPCIERRSLLKRSRSASTSISTIFPPLIVKPMTTNSRPPAIAMAPTAPLTSAGRAPWARPRNCLATAGAP
jgi:hypothetical protein